MLNAPCKDCKRRQFKCHDYCELYKEFAKNNELRRQKSLENKKIDNALYDLKRRR